MNTGEATPVVVSPIEDFFHLLNSTVLGESTIEDFILLIGTMVATIAFILWCCFPVQPKDPNLSGLHNLGKNTTDEQKYNQLVMEYDLTPT